MSKRRFSLLVRDLEWNEISSYAFGEIGSSDSSARIYAPNGLGGFEQSLTVQEGEVIDYIVKQTIKKNDIKLSLAFNKGDPVAALDAFREWCGSYIDASKYRLTLRIQNDADDASRDRYADIAYRKLEPSERKGSAVMATLTLQPLTLFYSKESTNVIISVVTVSKAYPYTYPYSYGGGTYGQSGRITNAFMKAIPLIVTFHGHISSPQASLVRNGEAYATIKFNGLDLKKGCSLTVDAVNGRIIYTDEDGSETDYYNEIDKTEDTFLWAEPGESVLSPNLDQTDASKPTVDVKIVQYTI